MILLATFVQVADILNARLSEGMEVREIVEKEGKKEKGEVKGKGRAEGCCTKATVNSYESLFTTGTDCVI